MEDSGLKAACETYKGKNTLCGRGVIIGVQEFSKVKEWVYIRGLQIQHRLKNMVFRIS